MSQMHAGQPGDVEQDDQQRHADIADRHDRNDDVRRLGDPVDAAVDDQPVAMARTIPVQSRGIAKAVERGAGDRIALKRVEADGEGGDQADRIDHREPAVILRPVRG